MVATSESFSNRLSLLFSTMFAFINGRHALLTWRAEVDDDVRRRQGPKMQHRRAVGADPLPTTSSKSFAMATWPLKGVQNGGRCEDLNDVEPPRKT